MGWAKDGSGLLVRRVKGRTIPRGLFATCAVIHEGVHPRYARRWYKAKYSNVDMARASWRKS